LSFSQKLFQVRSFITYWLDAVDEHSLHSPFLFNFYTNVLKKNATDSLADPLNLVRQNYEQDGRSVSITDFGAGSVTLKTPERKISDIARLSATPEKYSKLYSRIIKQHGCKQIVELGTSLGITTTYLAGANNDVEVVTFEGSPELAMIARSLFQDRGLTNIKVIEGNIDNTLLPYVSAVKRVDFVLMDANHRYDATLKYFEWLLMKVHDLSIIVMDDIHYSSEMEEAWHQVQTHERVFTTIDLYRCGLIFFNPSLTRQNVVLEF
jgi:predicted O-methyltransferase YrrM